MTRLPRLYLRMLRYRVAAMVWMFMFLGAAFNGRLGSAVAELAWAALALASSYVAATTLNDVADRDVDRVNHPRDAGRPLVSGEASERDLLLLHTVASAMALAAALPLGLAGVGLVAGSLVIGQVYSARPFVLSHRTYLAPSSLGVAYVLVPYGLGVVAVGSVPDGGDVVFCAGLFALFVTRINLKDFRDRRGDALYGRPTLLLRFGKDVTCGVSLVTLVVGNVCLVVALHPPLAVAAILELFALAIAWMLRGLRTAPEGRAEQVAIGIGAKMGNGLLLTALGWLILAGSRAPARDRILFLGVLAGAFAVSFAKLVQSPERAVLGYKG